MFLPIVIEQYQALKRSYGTNDLLAFDMQDGRVAFVGGDADVVSKVLGATCDTALGLRTARLDRGTFDASRHRLEEQGYRTRLIEQTFVLANPTTC